MDNFYHSTGTFTPCEGTLTTTTVDGNHGVGSPVSDVCPHCGKCPTCGQPYKWAQPQQPYWYPTTTPHPWEMPVVTFNAGTCQGAQ